MKKLIHFLLLFFIGLCFFFPASAKKCLAQGKLTVSMPAKKTIKIHQDKTIKLKVYFDGIRLDYFDYKAVVKVNNKKISGDFDVYDDEIEITGEMVGKCKLTVIVTYAYEYTDYDDEFDTFEDEEEEYTIKKTCNISVIPNKGLCASGKLLSYNTRSNVFSVKIQNLTRHSITVLSSRAYAMDDDYKSFDRDLRLTGKRKKVIIKPWKSKIVKFKVIGRNTWWNYKDFDIFSYWKWKGKKIYTAARYSGISKYTKGRWRDL